MRGVRILTVSALTLSAAAVLPPAASADPPPRTAFSVDVASGGTDFTTDDYYQAGVTVDSGDAATPITFTSPAGDPAVGSAASTLTVGTTDGAAMTATTYDLASSDLQVTISREGNWCYASSGSVTISELTTDPSSDISALAAHYSVICSSGETLTGDLLFNSAQPYSAAQVSTRSWDFGTQLAKGDDPAAWAKQFTFTNTGTTSITYGAAAIAPSATARNYSISGDTCAAHTVASGASCTLSVIPRPQAVNAAPVASVLTLATDGSLPARVVPLAVQGTDTPGIYVNPGPGHIQTVWSRLPAPIGSGPSGWEVYRGTSPSHLAPIRNTGLNNPTDTTITTGRTYYYAVRPRFGNEPGDQSPAVAAIAWPRYSAGTYHRLGAATRFVSGHKVVAGHPYTLEVDGQHGLPTSRVAAVALTVTASRPSAATTLTLYPTGTRRPAQPDVIAARGATRSNFAIVKVGTGGRITIATTHGSTPVYVDVAGYYSAAGLSSRYGSGGAAHTYTEQGTILDTKAYHIGALPHGYYIPAPVNFNPIDTPHVTSLAVEITAYGSRSAGSITAYATDGRTPAATTLAYAARVRTTTYAIVAAGRFTGDDFNQYPSISLLNRGASPVQLIVTILGYYDDETFLYGERYTPTSPIHLSVKNPLYKGSSRLVSPGSHAGFWTAAMNVKVAVSAPTTATTVALWPRGIAGVGAPSRPQLRAAAHQATVASSPVTNGLPTNQFWVRNAAGRTSVSVWSFGVFSMYPIPDARDYASAGGAEQRPSAVAPGPAPVTHRSVARR